MKKPPLTYKSIKFQFPHLMMCNLAPINLFLDSSLTDTYSFVWTEYHIKFWLIQHDPFNNQVIMSPDRIQPNNPLNIYIFNKIYIKHHTIFFTNWLCITYNSQMQMCSHEFSCGYALLQFCRIFYDVVKLLQEHTSVCPREISCRHLHLRSYIFVSTHVCK